MCLAVIDWRNDQLSIIANRDEFLARPTAQAHYWPDKDAVFAGKDLQAGGTWLGIGPHRCALVTNVRDPSASQGRLSRGALVADFLSADIGAMEYAQALTLADFSPFNLILFAENTLVYVNNHPSPSVSVLDSGIYGVSNAQLNTPWPKLTATRAAMNRGIDEARHAMADTSTYPDADLPDTGIPLEWEKRLSSARIVGSDYATRCTSEIHYDGQRMRMTERQWPDGELSRGQF